MQPQFVNYESGYGAELCCPRCGSNFLHHDKIEVFERPEDAAHGLHVAISDSKATVDTHLDKNPSRRRDGLLVTFWCEGCHGICALTIAQHKGVSLVDIVDTRENRVFNAHA